MRLPWLIAVLLAVLCLTLLLADGEEGHARRAELARARDQAAEFRHDYFRAQALLGDVDKDRAAQAATVQQLAAHVSQRAVADLQQQKLMDELKQKLDAKEGDVSSGGGIVTVHVADEILFASGEAELSKRGHEVLGKIGDVLKPLADKQILVGGHTDDAPIHTARFASNWELSTARAVNVVHFLVDTVGVDPRKLTAAGYSQYHPRGLDRAHNRRIELQLIPALATGSTPPADGAAAAAAKGTAAAPGAAAAVPGTAAAPAKGAPAPAAPSGATAAPAKPGSAPAAPATP
jgi:chemotaxis protein MotB